MVNARTLLILIDVNVDVALKSKSTTSKNPINFEQDVKVALKSKPPPSSGRGENNFPSWMSIAAGLTQHKPCSYVTAATHTHKDHNHNKGSILIINIYDFFVKKRIF